MIDEYSEAMENGAKFPAVTCFSDGKEYWLVDGFHRVAAAEKAGQTRIEAVVRPGSLLDAQWYSFGVNKTHGLRRTNEDKQRAVAAALAHDLGKDRSDGAIAEHCGVTQPLVHTIREQLTSTGRVFQSTTRTGKDGRKYNIEKIQESNKARATKTTTTTTTQVTVITAEPQETNGEPKTPSVLKGEGLTVVHTFCS